jgi:hypothetical protein
VLSPEVKNQDLFYIAGLLGNVDTQAAAWELFKGDFPAIKEKAGESLSDGFASFAGFFCDEKLRDDAQDFFAAQNLPGTERVLQNAKDSVNACIEHTTRDALRGHFQELSSRSPVRFAPCFSKLLDNLAIAT